MTEWVNVFRGDGQPVIRKPLLQYKERRAPFTLEAWRYDRPRSDVDIAVRTFLWLTGSASLPDEKGIVRKDVDELLKTCVHCNAVFLPPTKVYFPTLEGARLPRPEPWVVCTACNRTYPRRELVDNHVFFGTYDRVGAHLAWRYEQLRKVLLIRGENSSIVADAVQAPEAADFLYRVLRRDHLPAQTAYLEGERGGVDRMLQAQTVNNSEATYVFADVLATELSKGVPLERFFRNLMKG